MRSDQPGCLPQENPHGAAFQTPSLLLSDMVGSKQALSPASTSFSSTCYYDHQLTVCMSDAGSGQAGLYLSSLLLSQTGIQQKLKKELVPLGGQEGTQEKTFPWGLTWSAHAWRQALDGVPLLPAVCS